MKKILYIIIIILLFLTGCTSKASVEDLEESEWQPIINDVTEYDYEIDFSLPLDENEHHWYYEQLDETQKLFYQQVKDYFSVSNYEYLDKFHRVLKITNLVLRDMPANKMSYQKYNVIDNPEMRAYFNKALVALHYDYPEILLLTSFYPIGITSSAISEITDDNKTDYQIESILIGSNQMYVPDSFTYEKLINGMNETFTELDPLVENQSTLKGKLKIITEYMNSHIVYNDEAVNSCYKDELGNEHCNEDMDYTQSLYGAFVDYDDDGMIETVCKGWSDATVAICNHYGINCAYASGSGHAYTFVQMDDNKWYILDVLWSMPDDNWAWFLGGTDTKDGVGNKLIEESAHAPTPILYSSRGKIWKAEAFYDEIYTYEYLDEGFTYYFEIPELSKERYTGD